MSRHITATVLPERYLFELRLTQRGQARLNGRCTSSIHRDLLAAQAKPVPVGRHRNTASCVAKSLFKMGQANRGGRNTFSA
jgi:hypothetical protein